jgi:Na+/phosphate symporter
MTQNFKSILYNTIHRNKKGIEQIADEIGVSSNSLYRYCIEGESGSEMPARRLVPLMKATNNYELLKHIAYLCGFVCIKMPRFLKVKNDELELISDYQETTIRATRELRSFFDNPNAANYDKVSKALREVIEKSVTNQEYCKKTYSGQLEINFDEN